MRIFVIKQDTDLKGVGETLLKGTSKPAPASLERIRALNPHLDEKRIAAGTVLLVPDSPEFASGKTEPAAATVFDDFQHDIAATLQAAGAHLREGLSRREEQDKEVGKAIKSAALSKLAADDSELRARIDDANQRLAANAREAKQVTADFDAMQTAVDAEMKKLRGLAGR